jgi:TRAP-type C4-dicarboxylate transport system substrate-binding protein
MKGVKIAATGMGWADIFEIVDMVPVSLTYTEVRTGLERGTVDGWCSEAHIFDTFGTADAAQHVVWGNFGGLAGWPGGINMDFWNKLPADIQEIVDEVSTEYIDTFYEYRMEEQEGVVDMLRDTHGMKFYQLPEAERQSWKQQAEGLMDAWAAEQNAKGLAGTEVADAWNAALQKYWKVETIGAPTTWDN